MVDPNWGLLQGNNQFMNNFQMGVSLGDRVATTGRARSLDNALSAFAKDPSQQNLNVIIDRDPRTGIQLQDQQRKSAAEQRRRELIPLAARGDENSLLELWGVDPDTAMKLDDNSKKKAVDGIKYISGAAFQIVQLPPEQRPAAWDAYIDQAVGQYPGLAQYKGKYSPEALNSIVSQAGQMPEFQKFQQPRYVPVGEQGLQPLQYGKPMAGGPMVNSSTQQKAPAAPATKADYDKLPAGAQYTAPDGSIRTKPGGASSNTGGGFSGFKRAIIAQETRGRYGVTNAEGSGAMGVGQIMPKTGAALAKREGLPWRPDLMRGNSEEARAYQDRLTDAALKEAWQYGGGDPEKAAKYYFAGPNQKGWGSKTRQYGADVTRRMGVR